MPGRSSALDRQESEEKIITVEEMEVAFGETVILKDISFTVRKGEAVVILGPSGCGKTTLIRAITGLVPVHKGRITVVGEEITAGDAEPTLSRVRQQIGMLFQGGALLESMTVAENVALPLNEFTNLPSTLVTDIVNLKLNLVGLAHAAHLMPGELSGGMKKRAGLARSMVLDPSILFCDEPASGLDPITARDVDELLLGLNRYLGITLVVVTHELATIRNISDHCIMLDPEEKTIIAEGTLKELMDSKEERVKRFFERYVDNGLSQDE